MIGITGGIACGKTEVAKVFQKKGAIILSGDQIGKEVVEKNKGVLRQLVKTFGQGILKKDGTLNRRKLGEIAFASHEVRDKLNQIVHPHLLRELGSRIEKLRRKSESGVAVVDAALIVEWGLEKELDYLIFVESKREDKIKRLQKEKGYSRREALDRIKSQLPEIIKKAKADFVIRNDRKLSHLREKAERTWGQIMAEQF
ncbi:MAG: dephospho-CoA kinase [candidate division Zixibacteria bacterium]|nr:dephospho-CoA kinase [candidate division Zixibacteria bacterium]